MVSMTLQTMLGVSVIILAFTVYYLEKEIGKEGVFWGYAALGLIFGAAAVVKVAHDAPDESFYIIFATIFTLVAILYYEEEEAPEAKTVEKKKVKKREKKGKKAELDSYKALLKDLETGFKKGKISKDVYKRQKKEYEKKLRELG